MRKLCKLTLLATVVFLLSAPTLVLAQTQVVLDFEDLDLGPGEQIPDGYGGIAMWGTHGAWDFWTVLLGDENYQAHSGIRMAYSFGLGVPIEFGAEYIFDGAWISGPALPFEPVYFELYREGELVHTTEQIVITSEPIWIASGYSDPVDEVLVWQLAGFAIFCMDDFTYTIPVVAAEGRTWSAVKDLYR